MIVVHEIIATHFLKWEVWWGDVSRRLHRVRFCYTMTVATFFSVINRDVSEKN